MTVDTTATEGRISKSFEVTTNDPENPSVVLVVYGTVEPSGGSE